MRANCWAEYAASAAICSAACAKLIGIPPDGPVTAPESLPFVFLGLGAASRLIAPSNKVAALAAACCSPGVKRPSPSDSCAKALLAPKTAVKPPTSAARRTDKDYMAQT